MALFCKTAKQWRDENPTLKGNMRDYGTVSQLICLSNIENLNAHFITENIPQSIRLQKLNQIAIHQMSILQQSEIQLVNNSKLQVRSKKNKYE